MLSSSKTLLKWNNLIQEGNHETVIVYHLSASILLFCSPQPRPWPAPFTGISNPPTGPMNMAGDLTQPLSLSNAQVHSGARFSRIRHPTLGRDGHPVTDPALGHEFSTATTALPSGSMLSHRKATDNNVGVNILRYDQLSQ